MIKSVTLWNIIVVIHIRSKSHVSLGIIQILKRQEKRVIL